MDPQLHGRLQPPCFALFNLLEGNAASGARLGGLRKRIGLHPPPSHRLRRPPVVAATSYYHTISFTDRPESLHSQAG